MLLLNSWPIKHTFTTDKYVQHKQVRRITRISHYLLCCCQCYKQARAAYHECMVPISHVHLMNKYTHYEISKMCIEGFNICSFLLLAKRKISETAGGCERHRKVRHRWACVNTAADKQISAYESLLMRSGLHLSYAC